MQAVLEGSVWGTLKEVNDQNTPLAGRLNAFVPHRHVLNRYQMKIFIIERIVSALLEKLDLNAANKFNFIHQREEYVNGMKGVGKEPRDYSRFLLLDALKGQYLKTRQPAYLNLYRHYHAGKS
jgi:hypothetical protein